MMEKLRKKIMVGGKVQNLVFVRNYTKNIKHNSLYTFLEDIVKKVFVSLYNMNYSHDSRVAIILHVLIKLELLGFF